MVDRSDMPDEERSKGPAESWEAILSRRIGEEADAEKDAIERKTAEMRAFGTPKKVRLSDLTPPSGKGAPTKPPQVVPDPRILAMLRQELETSEDRRVAAEARVAELQREIEGLRGMIEHSNAAEVEELRMQLAEAREIIRMIEQAYLAGQAKPHKRPSRDT